MLRVAQSGSDSVTLEQQIRQRIESLSYLPTTAAVAMRFVELGKDPEADPADYAKVISSDASLSSKLLALANSSWFGVRNKVTKPNVAVNLLGLGTVRTLAISYCLTGLHSDLHLSAEESRVMWSAALCKAVAAKQYARHFDEKQAEEAFAAGLFQDFAISVMYATARERFLPIFEDATINWKTRLEKERDLFHLDHAEIGRIVAQKLELPELFIDAVAFHHAHESLKEFVERPIIADAVHVAALFPHNLTAWNRSDAEELRSFIPAQTASKPLAVTDYLAGVQKEFDQLYAYFENGQASELKLRDLLELATREAADNTTRLMGTVHELLREAASAGKEMHQILSQHDKLQEAAFHDSLTNALNRDGFTTKAGEMLTKAARYGMSCNLVFLDVDRFKDVNDTMGHHVGDEVLKKLVEVATQNIRATDFIGRVGGDEFIVFLAECTEDEALRIAQSILAQVAATPMGRGSAQCNITLSAGLLVVPARGGAHTLEGLTPLADKLMYEAKRAGGNRIARGRVQAAAAA